MNSKLLLQNLRNIPDFPKPGIQFKDVSTLFKIRIAIRKCLMSWCASIKTKALQKL